MPAMQSHDFLTPIRGNAILNLNNIQAVSLVTSLTNNLQTKVNVLRLSSANLKHTKTHSSSGLYYTIDWNHLGDNFVRADTVDGFRKAVHHWD